MDKYQGQQNDYILLSLVRTKNVGHIRDVRRLVVALSRARLGLYIFARTAVFNTCHELACAFKQLMARPQSLVLLPKEEYPTKRLLNQVTFDGKSVIADGTGSKSDLNVSNSDLNVSKSIVTITHMPEMVDFVYKFYSQKIEEWKVSKPYLFEPKVTTQIQVVKEDQVTEESSEVTKEPSGVTKEPSGVTEESEEEDVEFGFEPLAEDDTGVMDQELDTSELEGE